MKKNNFKKVLLVLALATAVVGPNFETTYAADKVEVDVKYHDTYTQFEKTLKDARDAKASYKYLNGSYLSQKGLDAAIKDAEVYEGKVDKYKGTDEARLNLITATTNLKAAIDALNGSKTSTKELGELVGANDDFINSFVFKLANKKEKDAYLDAYDKAYRTYLYNKDGESISKAKVDGIVKNLKTAKEAITKTYAPLASKQVLKDEISLANSLRNDRDKYTKKSFDSFLSALRLAETSVEDKSNIKTAEEYKELTNTLKSAREALVEKTSEDEKTKDQIKKLEEAKQNNKTSTAAARLLLEIAPEKVKDVKGELLKLINESEELIKMADKLINELKGIKG